MHVVVDTDAVLSGLRSPTGASRLILRAIRAEAIVLLASVAIMLEYEAVLKRDRNLAALDATPREIDVFLDGLAALARPVPPGFRHRPPIRDPDDEIFIEAAINGQADALITFNTKDHCQPDPYGMVHGIDVCRPGEFLRRLTWRPLEPEFSSRPR